VTCVPAGSVSLLGLPLCSLSDGSCGCPSPRRAPRPATNWNGCGYRTRSSWIRSRNSATNSRPAGSPRTFRRPPRHRASQALQAPQDRREARGCLVVPDRRVAPAHRASRGLQAATDHRDHPDRKALQGHRVRKGRRGTTASPDRKAHRARPVRKANRDHPGRARRARKANAGCKARRGRARIRCHARLGSRVAWSSAR
jgi:hypothetical protein